MKNLAEGILVQVYPEKSWGARSGREKGRCQSCCEREHISHPESSLPGNEGLDDLITVIFKGSSQTFPAPGMSLLRNPGLK